MPRCSAALANKYVNLCLLEHVSNTAALGHPWDRIFSQTNAAFIFGDTLQRACRPRGLSSSHPPNDLRCSDDAALMPLPSCSDLKEDMFSHCWSHCVHQSRTQESTHGTKFHQLKLGSELFCPIEQKSIQRPQKELRRTKGCW